jgi:hypothetical protein
VTPEAEASVPAEDVKVMVAPATGVPLESVAVAVMVAPVLLPATMLARLEVTAMALTTPPPPPPPPEVDSVSLPQAASIRAAAAHAIIPSFRISVILRSTMASVRNYAITRLIQV